MDRTSLTLYIPAALLPEVTDRVSRWADGVRGSDSWLGTPDSTLVPALGVSELPGAVLVPAGLAPRSVEYSRSLVMALRVHGPEWALQDLLGELSTGSEALCAGIGVANAELASR